MTTLKGLHLAAAAVKPQNSSLILTCSRPKISLSSHKSSLQSLLRRPLSFSYSHWCLLPSSFFATAFSKTDEEEGSFELPHADDEPEDGQQQSSIESRRLYVGNLSFSMTSSELSDIFSEAGKIDQVEIIYDRATYQSRGFAFVTMATAEEANKAIRMFDGAQIGSRTAKVNFPEVPKGGEREMIGPKLRANSRGYVNSPHKLYAGNLGWKVTSESLRDAFSACSGLLGTKIIYERDSGRSRGFGFVTFISASECQAAMEAMNGKMVAGRPLRLNLASDKTSSEAPLLAADSSSTESYVEEISVDEESSLESNLV
ncbi:hypothetical protein IEQ34_015817 [Dendrobium chrysotoxum]|uniref:RRM domain-containing protein n=1 Tax=Dendrobium chrysotoxum TaxID=161865 RepID=A0AAV7GHQ2_DENCH|nr:hypothetical protein IEQ34_015817 [Dendrobium chrysotoxum]